MFVTTKLKTIILSILIISVSVILSFLIQNKPNTKKTTETIPKLGITIVLDAGHGGIDPGSIGKKTKITESELNLKITLKLKQLLTSGGFDVILTRSNSNGLYGAYSKNYKTRDMEARKNIIQSSNANLLISIHMNSFVNSSCRGAQVFYNKNNSLSCQLANSIQECFSSDLPDSNKGSSIGDYYILKCDNSIPSVLCECGYLSNPDDELLLTSEDYQNKLSYSIYKGIVNYFSLKS